MALSITSITFDQPVYNPGDTITCTVAYTSTDAAPSAPSSSNVTVTVSDSASNVSKGGKFSVAAAAASALATTVSAVDDRSPAGTWTVVSNDLSGAASPWQGTAVLTSVA